MIRLATVTKAAGTPEITVVVVVVVFPMATTLSRLVDGGVVVVGSGTGGSTVTGALASTIGRAKADMTMPVVRNQASSLQGLLDESSLCLLAMRVGMGERR